MICTFYSFKGGAGRSMALANVAKWFTMQGLSVTMVDWDLEAPGLESFFYGTREELDLAGSALGLIDMLVSYKRDYPAVQAYAQASERPLGEILDDELPFDRLLHTLPGSTETARLRLLTAGWRTNRLHAYGAAVQSFDWNEFYERFDGEAFFEWLRNRLLSSADVVLIDSRTGFTEMGGVCTRQLADVVVSLCAPNRQSLDGVTAMTASFRDSRLIAQRKRDLEAMIVPTRIDVSEVKERRSFERQFREIATGFTPLAFRSHGRELWQLRIPYVPLYAYGEKLAIGVEQTIEELVTAYQLLAVHIALLGGPEETALRDLWSKFWRSNAGQVPSAVATAFNVPQRPRHFVGRRELVEAIEQRLAGGTPVVLAGLAGAGKTALAIEYAYQRRGQYDVVWLIDAAELDDGWAAMAAALSLVPTDEFPAHEVVHQWLERNERWLLIIDAAEDVGELMQELPKATHGHVMITSRDADWSEALPGLEVGALPIEEAMALIEAHVGPPDEPDELKEFALRLGCLPLAVEMAARHVKNSAMPMSGVLKLIDEQPERTLGRAITPIMSDVEAAARESAAAADVLGLYAYLGDGPVRLGPILTASPLALGELEAISPDPFAVEPLIRVLRRRSLALVRSSLGLEVNPLVKAAVRERLTPLRRAAYATLAAIAAGRGAVEDPDLLPHAAAAVERINSLDFASPPRPEIDQELAITLDALATRFDDAAQPDAALAAAFAAVGAWRRLSGTVDQDFAPELATSLMMLSGRLGDLGRAEEALESAEESVTLWRHLSAHGSAYSRASLATALTALAERLVAVGRADDALACAHESVAVWARLGDVPPELLPEKAASFGVLAQHLAETGRYEESLSPASEALAVWGRLAEERFRRVEPEPHMATSEAVGIFSVLGVEAKRRGRQAIGFLVVNGRRMLPLHYVHQRPTMPGHAADRFRAALQLSYSELDTLAQGRMRRSDYLALLESRGDIEEESYATSEGPSA